METIDQNPGDDSATSVAVNYCIGLSRQFQQAIEKKQEDLQQKKEQQQQQQQPQQKQNQKKQDEEQEPSNASTACNQKNRITKVVMEPCELKLPLRLETWLSNDGTLIVRPSIEFSAMSTTGPPLSTSSSIKDFVAGSCSLLLPKPTAATMTTTSITTNSSAAECATPRVHEDEEETPVCDCSAASQCRCCQHRHAEEILFDQVGTCIPTARKRSVKTTKEPKKNTVASTGTGTGEWRQQQDMQAAPLIVEKPPRQHRQLHPRHNHQHRQQVHLHQKSREQAAVLRNVEARIRSTALGDSSRGFTDRRENSSEADKAAARNSQLSSSEGSHW